MKIVAELTRKKVIVTGLGFYLTTGDEGTRRAAALAAAAATVASGSPVDPVSASAYAGWTPPSVGAQSAVPYAIAPSAIMGDPNWEEILLLAIHEAAGKLDNNDVIVAHRGCKGSGEDCGWCEGGLPWFVWRQETRRFAAACGWLSSWCWVAAV